MHASEDLESQLRAADGSMAAVVKLKYGDTERSTRLVNNQLHIPTIKDMFGLSSVDVEGVAEPADDRGFTFATYLSGSTLHISGSPAQAAVLSGTVHTVFHNHCSVAHRGRHHKMIDRGPVHADQG